MATAVVSGFLDVNSGVSAPFDDLALKVYSGMVLEAYNKATTTEGRHVQRSISSGKSAQFPAIGRTSAAFHTRGTEVTFNQVNSNERVITIQDLLISPIFLDVLDEAKSHFDVRRPYATQQGQALAEAADLRVLMSFIAASRTATATVTGLEGGQTVTNAVAASDVAALKGLIYDAAEILDTNSIPNSERYLWVKPTQYYLLLQDGEFIDRDFNDGDNGSRAHAVMRNASDFAVVKTTNLPTTSEIGDTDFPTTLRLDYTTNVAVCGHSSAAGSVTLMGLQFEAEYDMNRQGHMLIAKYAKGFDWLRQEAAVALDTA